MNFGELYSTAAGARVLKHLERRLARVNTHAGRLPGLTLQGLRDGFHAACLANDSEAAFAHVREVSAQVLQLRPFDVQIVGGLALLEGKLAQMRTGEGKTLAIAAPAAVMAAAGRGVHVVTSNEYLARRDAETLRPLYEALGLTVGALHSAQSVPEKQAAYACDITYGVGFEFGFDYLRDNLVDSKAARVQRGHAYAIVDEVDSVLIDEARVPMLISGSAADDSEHLAAANGLALKLTAGEHVHVDLKDSVATFTDQGYELAEAYFGGLDLLGAASLYAPVNLPLLRIATNAAKAHLLYKRDRDYVVDGQEILLVDQGTGRKMVGRRLESGLHEALEQKEGVPVRPGTVVRASITYQNYFSRYEALAGLSGTALTDADEFIEFYNLRTVVIPTNRPVAMKVHSDRVFLTKLDKFAAVVAGIRDAYPQPVLVGCTSVRDANFLSHILNTNGIAHQVLTARNVEAEASIIANAGRLGAVTVATNMAGRGTDIILGGVPPQEGDFPSFVAFQAAKGEWRDEQAEVLQHGGLRVLATERSGLRRVDDQLAGRAGRQGAPGDVQFLLSLEDDLLRMFGESRQIALATRLASGPGGAVGGKAISSLVAMAQAKAAAQGFEARRQLTQYDKVLADQREAVFSMRDSLLGDPEDLQAYARDAIEQAVLAWCDLRLPADVEEGSWDLAVAKAELERLYSVEVPIFGWVHKAEQSRPEILARLVGEAVKAYGRSKLAIDEQRQLMLSSATALWSDHLSLLAELREGVGLRATSGGNPLNAYQRDAFELFKNFKATLLQEFAEQLLSSVNQEARDLAKQQQQERQAAAAHLQAALDARWVLRNDPCPCGSGKRYKLCHGKLTR